MKTCTECGLVKQIQAFAFRSTAKNSRQSGCRDCRKKRDAKYYQDNRKTKRKNNAEHRDMMKNGIMNLKLI